MWTKQGPLKKSIEIFEINVIFVYTYGYEKIGKLIG